MYGEREKRGVPSGRAQGFTLVELLVVVSIIALLIAILLPSLKKAREQTKTVVCLTRCKAMGTGVMTYATEYDGKMPGPLHPAVYREQTMQSYRERGYSDTAAKYSRDRQLTWVIANSMGQRGGDSGRENVTDDVATCPSLESVLTDKHFEDFKTATNRTVFPTHYVINNYGNLSADPGPGGFQSTPRKTNPAYYFGYSPPLGVSTDLTSPQSMSRIKRSSDEWMVADAWYRARSNPPGFPQQEGPYQSGWSGEALPYQPPHRTKARLSVTTDTAARQTASGAFANRKQDGLTNTVYFDGHADSVQSRSLGRDGFTVLYGFRGTVNPDYRGLPQSTIDNLKSLEWY